MNKGELENCRRAAEQGDPEAAYKLGNVYYSGWKDRTVKLEADLSSEDVRKLELKHKATPQQERDLLFCAVLMTQNWQSATILPLITLPNWVHSKEHAQEMLDDGWSITDRDSAIDALEYLAIAGNHTKTIDAKYRAIHSPSELDRRYPDKNFTTVKSMLLRFGYTEPELTTLPTLAAWDYGRCGFIARYSLWAGYIDEAIAWEYIHLCAEHAAAKYDSWRQYLAAYVLGRALWGSDCLGMEHVLAYLLVAPTSPFKRGIDIKAGYKEPVWDFRYDGKSIDSDYTEAAKWYRKAAELGNAKAQCDLGYCYDTGKGVPQDLVEAVEWYRKSAEQGDVTAQCNIGNCYQNGRGVAKDLKLAEEWYIKAVEQGDEDAKKRLAKLKIIKNKKRNKLIIIAVFIIVTIMSYIKGRMML
ncbi:MAG: DUF1266 domain-containing protein [Deferribacteraceae bacterium]|jgi:TPR repeat protein|nr:DUF1266 domain-containing protein [Deferribacteraceae bacterium]